MCNLFSLVEGLGTRFYPRVGVLPVIADFDFLRRRNIRCMVGVEGTHTHTTLHSMASGKIRNIKNREVIHGHFVLSHILMTIQQTC
jgi:hypothetical protein